MATIEDLNKSITSMSEDEIFNLIKAIRASRRVTKVIKKCKGGKKKLNEREKVLKLSSNLTKEEIKALLKSLEEV